MILDTIYPQVALAALLALLIVSWSRCNMEWHF
jgi:hypothetical protein